MTEAEQKKAIQEINDKALKVVEAFHLSMNKDLKTFDFASVSIEKDIQNRFDQGMASAAEEGSRLALSGEIYAAFTTDNITKIFRERIQSNVTYYFPLLEPLRALFKSICKVDRRMALKCLVYMQPCIIGWAASDRREYFVPFF